MEINNDNLPCSYELNFTIDQITKSNLIYPFKCL